MRTMKAKTQVNWENLPVFLTLKQAAAIMNCSQATVRSLCREGVIPYMQPKVKLFRIDRDGFRKAIEKEMESHGEV